MAEPKEYWPKSGAKKIEFSNGGSMLKLNFHVETALAWLKTHANDRGYITINVSERRTPGERGDTHCMWLDKWKPDFNKARQSLEKSEPEKTSDSANSSPTENQPSDNDCPF